MAKLAPIVVDGYVAKESQGFDQRVDSMLGDHSSTPIDITNARMKAGALRAVFSGTEWLTAAQIEKLAGLGQANRSGAANWWKQRRKVFALQHDRQGHYPRYLFDDDFRPQPAAEQVQGVLEASAPIGLPAGLKAAMAFSAASGGAKCWHPIQSAWSRRRGAPSTPNCTPLERALRRPGLGIDQATRPRDP